MKLERMFVGMATALVFSQASATVIDWGVHGTLELGAVFADPGAFEDTITFSIPSLADITSTTVATNLLTTLRMDNGMVSLYREAGETDALVGSYSFDGTTGSTWHSYLSLVSGDYYYLITGDAQGSQGTLYTISSAIGESAPNPATGSTTSTDWGVHGLLEVGAFFTNPGTIQDTVTFSLSQASDITSTTVANDLRTLTSLEDGVVSLYREAGAIDLLVGSYSFDGTTGSTWHSYLSLPVGDYYYQVDGRAAGDVGAFYSIASTVVSYPVPEPGTIALLLGGLAASGLHRLRRRP